MNLQGDNNRFDRWPTVHRRCEIWSDNRGALSQSGADYTQVADRCQPISMQHFTPATPPWSASLRRPAYRQGWLKSTATGREFSQQKTRQPRCRVGIARPGSFTWAHKYGAKGETRTLTSKIPEPKSGASTNSATFAEAAFQHPDIAALIR